MTNFKNLSFSQKKYFYSIILSALIIKIFLVFTLPAEIRSDSLDYHRIAVNLVKLGEYSFESGKPTANFSCGYPLFLAGVYEIFGTEQIAVRLINSFLEIFTGIFFFLICLKLFDEKWSLIALAIFTFFPSNILFSQTVLTEPVFGMLAMVLLYYCLNENINYKIFFIGLIWGYAILIRSSFSLSVFLMLIYIFKFRKQLFEGFKEKRIKRVVQYSVLFLLGLVLVISPWLIRNKTTLNTFTIATQGGFTFWSGSNPNATGTWYYKIEESNPMFNISDEVERDRVFYKEGINYALKNPYKFIITGFKKIGYLFSSERLILLYFTKGDSGGKTSTDVYKSINPFLIALINIPYFAVMLMGAWGLLAFKKKRFFLYGFIITWMITFFLFVALARYHYVLIPFFVLGTVKLLMDGKLIWKELSITKKIIAIVFNLFLLGVWTSEFYLMYR
ncbi:MAG: glycosyltransferase family 39 protein [Ignavibacteria bacterium]|jgi:4-amino-4-deoxy-L-arabinose transferase-like glycosyltransferase